MSTNYDGFRAGMLRAAEMARNELKRAPEAAKGHDCVYMSGYEDACDHLSVVIAQAAVIDSVRIAGPQPDWQYHISLLLPEGIEDATLLKIFQVVEHELRTLAPPEITRVEGERSAAAIYYEGLDRVWRLLDLKMERQTSDVATLQRVAYDHMVRGNALQGTENSIMDRARKLAVEISGDSDSAGEVKTFQQAWQIIEGVLADKANADAK